MSKNCNKEINVADKVVDNVFKEWFLHEHNIDSEVLDDIKSAIKEAYMEGALHGGLDTDVFKEALEFCKD